MWRLSSLFLALLLLCACSEPDKITSPNPVIPEGPEDVSLVSIAYVKNMYRGVPVPVRGDCKIRGEVISTDRYSNFNRKLAIRDGSAAIEIKLNRADLWKDYRLGDIIEIYCNGLTLGAYGGLVQLGMSSSGTVEATILEESEIICHVKWVGIAVTPPRPVDYSSVGELSTIHLSDIVQLPKMQIIDEEMYLKWCDDGSTSSDRRFVDESLDTLIVRTHGRADFAYGMVPQGYGLLRGILSYFNGKFQLICHDGYFDEFGLERF